MPTHDTNGREYAKFSKVKPGDRLECDGGFTCMSVGEVKEVYSDTHGALCVACSSGDHYIDGQLDDDTDALIGLYPLSMDTIEHRKP